MTELSHYIVFEQVSVQAANAVSSPISYGFPALSGFLGSVHALSRKLSAHQYLLERGVNIELDGVLVACHACHIKRYRTSPYADYSLNQTRNPLKKNGQTASIIEEGKVDVTVSLIVELCCDEDSFDYIEEHTDEMQQLLYQLLFQQRIAGGSVHGIKKVAIVPTSTDDKELTSALLPAYILMDASQHLIDITQELQQQNPEATAIDALIDVSTLHHIPSTYDESAASKQPIEWQAQNVKAGRGWLVPIPVGFQGIAPVIEAGKLQHCRTKQYDSQYVEAVYGLGQWVFPNRIQNIQAGFWRYQQASQDLYLIQQNTL